MVAEYTLTTPTAVAEGNTVPYNNTVCSGGCCIRHRQGSGIVDIRGGNCCRPVKYRVSFHGVVSGVQGAIQLGMFLDGELLPETLMAVVPGGTTALWSVDTDTVICSECSCSAVSVRVIEGDPVTVNTASIIVEKEVA